MPDRRGGLRPRHGAAIVETDAQHPGRPAEWWLRLTIAQATEATLGRAVGHGCAGVVLADCAGRTALQHLSAALAVAEAVGERPHGGTAIIAEVGSAGLLALAGVAGATGRLVALVRGAAEPGEAAALARGGGGPGFRPWLVAAARSAGVPAFDRLPRWQPLGAGLVAARRAGLAGVIAPEPRAVNGP